MAKAKKTTGITLDERRKLFKDFAKNTLDASIFSGDDEEAISISRLSLNMPVIDDILGGGLPKGRIIDIYGPESAGKSTFCLEVIKQSQLESPDNYCLFIDAENALDLTYAIDGIGIDEHRLDILQADDLVQGLSVLGKAVESKIYSVIVFDSTAAKIKVEDSTTNYVGNDSNIGHEARTLSMCLGKIVHPVAESNAIVLFTSQLRSKIGVYYGSSSVPTGGNALKFYASVRLEIKKKGIEKIGDSAIAHTVSLKTVKNKTFKPYQECEFSIVFGEGFDRIGAYIAKGLEAGIITKSGSWYKYNGDNVAQGFGNLREFFKNHDQAMNGLMEALRRNE